MELYLNEEKVEVIEKYFDLYPFEGITTNTKMIGALGKTNYAQTLKNLRKAVGDDKKIFAQVTSDNYNDILREAEYIVSAGGLNTYVKVPANEVGIKALKTLHEQGYRTLGTICLNSIQAIMALQAGADYVAVFYNYMVEAGYDASKTLKDIAAYVRQSNCHGKVMGVGCKKQEQFSDCVGCGCGAMTVNAGSLTEWMYNEPAVATTKNFMDGWINTWGDTRIKDFI